MKNYDLLSGSFLLILSIGACLMAYRLRLGDIYNPGAGLIPFGVAALLGLMSIGLSIRGLLDVTKGYEEKTFFKRIEWGRVVMVLCALVGVRDCV